jgi:hypothetical protein
MNDTPKIKKDLAASVRQRLSNLARESKRPFDEILQYYLIERFLYRLSVSSHKNKLILKGALMFFVWNLTESRATRDIDFLGITSNSQQNIVKVVTEICDILCTEDAVKFFSETVTCERIQEQNEYNGILVRFDGELAKARVRMQMDIGFGDVVYPEPGLLEYPTLLKMTCPVILGYTPETLIAEKVHAMVRFGEINSRIKDYFDVWFLLRQFSFSGQRLSEAIYQTFLKRQMPIPISDPLNFFDLGVNTTRLQQWNAFVEKNHLTVAASVTFQEVIEQIKQFIQPVFDSRHRDELFKSLWKPPGPWL